MPTPLPLLFFLVTSCVSELGFATRRGRVPTRRLWRKLRFSVFAVLHRLVEASLLSDKYSAAAIRSVFAGDTACAADPSMRM